MPDPRAQAPQAGMDVLEDKLRQALSRVAAGPAPTASQLSRLAALRGRCHAGLSGQPVSEPLRTLHHFACTGGTLIAKSLASMPNTLVLSEIDPLSRLHLREPKPPFFPTDLVIGLRYSAREISDSTILKMFEAALVTLRDDLQRQGLRLVLRDHAHSQFCTRQDSHARPDLHAIACQIAPTLGVVTVRHPLDSYISLKRNGWVHFQPDTLEEYCLRYIDFLEAHAGLPVIKYETFVASPGETAARICSLLDLPFDPDFEFLMPLARLSGDSGRSGVAIAPRPRAQVPADLQQEADASSAYPELCHRLEYDA